MSVLSLVFRVAFFFVFAYVLFLGLSYVMWTATETITRDHSDDLDIELDDYVPSSSDDYDYDLAFGEV